MSGSEAQRLHEALCDVSERLAAVLEGARFEQRDGHVFMTFPTFPLPSFNGIWPDDDSVPADLESSLRSIEDAGIPAGIAIRGEMKNVREAARALGYTAEEPIPGMVATAAELRMPPSDLEILRVETADGLAQALSIAAEGFELPADLLAPIYLLEVAELPGIHYYVARLDGVDVSTAVGWTIDRTVGIFNVATPPEHRRRGYGAAITAHTATEGLAAGADLVWLQSRAVGKSVYEQLGFREVVRYTLLIRPPEVSTTS
jgi:N-acetylglutamate synthase